MEYATKIKSKKILKTIAANEGLLDDIGKYPDCHLVSKYTASLYCIKKIRTLLGIPTYAEVPAYRLLWKRGRVRFIAFVEVISKDRWTYKELGEALKCTRQRAFQIYKSCLNDKYEVHESIASEYERLSGTSVSINRTKRN